MCFGLHVRYTLFLSDCNELSGQSFRKYSYIKFHENPSSESRVVEGGWAEMTKLRVAFRNFANASDKKLLNANEEVT